MSSAAGGRMSLFAIHINIPNCFKLYSILGLAYSIIYVIKQNNCHSDNGEPGGFSLCARKI